MYVTKKDVERLFSLLKHLTYTRAHSTHTARTRHAHTRKLTLQYFLNVTNGRRKGDLISSTALPDKIYCGGY